MTGYKDRAGHMTNPDLPCSLCILSKFQPMPDKGARLGYVLKPY